MNLPAALTATLLTTAPEPAPPDPTAVAPPPAAPGTEPATEPAKPAWSVGLSAYVYLVPDSRDYVQPTVTLDHGWMHFEARYNYEAMESGSVWVGANLGGGNRLAWELTPMLGGVLGDLHGLAPGVKGSLSWWRLELYTEAEWVWDVDDASASFFYNWSELTLAPADWFRFGLVTQRTRAYDSERDLQRGLLVGFSWRRFDLTGCVFNPDDEAATVVLAVGARF
jgi:hypothetical protein